MTKYNKKINNNKKISEICKPFRNIKLKNEKIYYNINFPTKAKSLDSCRYRMNNHRVTKNKPEKLKQFWQFNFFVIRLRYFTFSTSNELSLLRSHVKFSHYAIHSVCMRVNFFSLAFKPCTCIKVSVFIFYFINFLAARIIV